MDFDTILAKCGNGHRYQYLLLGLYSFLMVFVALQKFSQNVISFVPDHWCYHEQLENLSFAEIDAIYNKFERPSCTKLATVDLVEGNVTISDDRCDRWIYNYDFGFRSMNTELNWVCDDAYKAPVGQSFMFAGSIFGTIIFGILGDRIGRVKALILANWCGFLGDFSTIFVDSLTAFSLARFVSGLAIDANTYLMYILVVEYVSPKFRSIGLSICTGVFYGIGIIITSSTAILVGNWKYFLVCSSTPLILVTLFHFLVQESAQWLITRNDIDGAVKRLQRVAKINRRSLSKSDIQAFRNHCLKSRQEEKEKIPKVTDILKEPHFRKTMLRMLAMEMIIYLCYNTIARNVEGLGVSPFITFAMFGLSLPLAGLLRAYVQTRFNRKTIAFFALIFTGLVAASIVIVMSKWDKCSSLLVGLSILGRFGMSIAWGASLLFSTELIPTCVRSRCTSTAFLVGATASLSSPYIIHLRTYYRAAPWIILCGLFSSAAFMCLLLPETKNRKLCITLADGEKFGKGERMFDFLRKSSAKETVVEAELEAVQKLMS